MYILWNLTVWYSYRHTAMKNVGITLVFIAIWMMNKLSVSSTVYPTLPSLIKHTLTLLLFIFNYNFPVTFDFLWLRWNNCKQNFFYVYLKFPKNVRHTHSRMKSCCESGNRNKHIYLKKKKQLEFVIYFKQKKKQQNL